MFCGPLESLECCHIVIGEIKYDFDNCIDAIDLLYKSFFTLNAGSPVMSCHIWAFFQRYIYNMEAEKKTLAVRPITELIVLLDQATNA